MPPLNIAGLTSGGSHTQGSQGRRHHHRHPSLHPSRHPPPQGGVTYMYPSQSDDIIIVLSIKHFLFAVHLTGIRVPFLLGNNDMCDPKLILGLKRNETGNESRKGGIRRRREGRG